MESCSDSPTLPFDAMGWSGAVIAEFSPISITLHAIWIRLSFFAELNIRHKVRSHQEVVAEFGNEPHLVTLLICKIFNCMTR